ncbi:MAG: family 20 glycosylhydrolase [Oscillospiraceae bacterium]|nr:family 20 glycosylhydrolase [Oscillospiraceae bacterium]
MKRTLSVLLCIALLLTVLPSRAEAVAETLTDSYTAGEGSFALTEAARLFLIAEETPSEEILQMLRLICAEFAAAGKPTLSPLPIVWGEAQYAQETDLILVLTEDFEKEAYSVSITARQVLISASGAAGLLYGARMVLKTLIAEGGTSLPSCTYAFTPDTKERVLMLDCARKYWSVAWIKNLLHEMSWLGYNALELHLTDDQGIRSNIWSDGADCNGNDFGFLIGYDSNWNTDYPDPNAEQSYSADDLRQIVSYAKQLHIEIIPGCDVPSHCDVMTSRYADYVAAHPDFTFRYNEITYFADGMEQDGARIPYGDNADFFSIRAESTRATVDVTNPVARAFALAVVQGYADFFRKLGCTKINIGFDELNVSDGDGWGDYAQAHINGGRTRWDTAADFANETAKLLKEIGYTSVRAFNDVLCSDNVHIPLRQEIELCVWNPDGSEPVGQWLASGRVLHNCLQNYCYYVLRTGGSGDARDAENYWWSFHHATPRDIYNEWTPGRLYPYDRDGTSLEKSEIGSGYFLIWGDFGGWRTEREVWDGDENGLYNLIDRMWSNSAKMLDWELNERCSFENFCRIRDGIRLFPGYTDCTEEPVMPDTPEPVRLPAADHGALWQLLQNNRRSDPDGVYVPEQFRAFEQAYQAAWAVNENFFATQEEVDAAAAALQAAIDGLHFRDARVVVPIRTETETVSAILSDGFFGHFFIEDLPDGEIVRIDGSAAAAGGLLIGIAPEETAVAVVLKDN